MPTPPSRRSAKSRPLSGLLISDGRREEVVVTAHEMRLVINVEADISVLPLSRVRRDDALNLWRTDRNDWLIRFDTPPPPESWVHDVPLQPQVSPLRRLALIVLAPLGLIAAGLLAARAESLPIAARPLPDLAKAIAWPDLGPDLGPSLGPVSHARLA
jgi:hypothetical protein